MSALVPLYNAATLRQWETQACAALGGEAFALMRRAGEAAWRCLLQHWPNAQRLLVVCGPGNNGGDGYVLAQHASQSGREVHVLRLQAHVPRSELARRACAQYQSAGGSVVVYQGDVPEADVLVDAIFGIGLDRAVDGETTALIAQLNHHAAPVLALDVPSGVISDTGAVPSAAIRATRTLQFLGNHTGLRTGRALDLCGALETAPLDVPAELRAGLPAAWLADARHPPELPPRRDRDSHKGGHGHVLCIGGDAGYGGAALLCCDAALRAGAGLVSLATRAATARAALVRRPECMAHAVDSRHALQPLLQRCDVIAIGPGLGQSAWSRELLHSALAAGKPLVIDADALNLLAAEPALRGQFRDAILTPHPGEAARLLASDTAGVQTNRFAAAQELADTFAAVTVLKGAGSIVAAPGRIPCVIGAGNPGMAVGGMGDALTGAIAAMRAQGLPAFEAACAGAWLHAMAGDAVAQAQGEAGLLPSDLIAQLPRVLHAQAQP